LWPQVKDKAANFISAIPSIFGGGQAPAFNPDNVFADSGGGQQLNQFPLRGAKFKPAKKAPAPKKIIVKKNDEQPVKRKNPIRKAKK